MRTGESVPIEAGGGFQTFAGALVPGFDVPHVLTLAALARTDVRYSQRIERNESCELHRCLRSPPPPPEPCRRRLCEADDYKYRVQTSETIINPSIASCRSSFQFPVSRSNILLVHARGQNEHPSHS
jgi:hypothetical protein